MPTNNFFNFLAKFRRMNTGLTCVEVAKAAGSVWRKMSCEEKEEYSAEGRASESVISESVISEKIKEDPKRLGKIKYKKKASITMAAKDDESTLYVMCDRCKRPIRPSKSGKGKSKGKPCKAKRKPPAKKCPKKAPKKKRKKCKK